MSEYQKYPADKRKFDEAWEKAFGHKPRYSNKALDKLINLMRKEYEIEGVKMCSPEHIGDVNEKVCGMCRHYQMCKKLMHGVSMYCKPCGNYKDKEAE